MSRSGYSDDLDPRQLALWRGRVASAIRGQRGQQLLRDLLMALDAMPEKCLIANALEREGDVCALGAVGQYRGVDVLELDPEDATGLGQTLNIAPCLAQEIEYINDEAGPWDYDETPRERWARVRRWVVSQINENKK